jgi:hypothetical protein
MAVLGIAYEILHRHVAHLTPGYAGWGADKKPTIERFCNPRDVTEAIITSPSPTLGQQFIATIGASGVKTHQRQP